MFVNVRNAATPGVKFLRILANIEQHSFRDKRETSKMRLSHLAKIRAMDDTALEHLPPVLDVAYPGDHYTQLTNYKCNHKVKESRNMHRLSLNIHC